MKIYKTEICEKIIKEKKREGNVEHLGSLKCGGEAISKCGETSYCSKTKYLCFGILPQSTAHLVIAYTREPQPRENRFCRGIGETGFEVYRN